MQIYSTPSGPALKVRTETRYGGKRPEHLFVLAIDRLVVTRWHTEIPPDFKLIHDPAAHAEAALALAEADALIFEKQVLLECLGSALGMLDERSAEQIRGIYRTKMEAADIVSLTKPKEIAL